MRNLIDINKWQRIQDNFSNITGVGLYTVDSNGSPITLPSGQSRLCGELAKKSHIKNKVCGPCIPTFLGGYGVIDKDLSFRCLANLHHFVVPLAVDKAKIVSYLIAGPVILVMRKSKEEYAKLAEALGIDIEDFENALSEIKVMSLTSMLSFIELVKDVGEYVLKLAYQNIQTERKMIFDTSNKINRLLNTLLDVALQVSGADTGSIMLMDKETNELTIGASKGLPDDVIKNAKVRLGDGISGTSAKAQEPFLIDETLADNRIKKYLTRPNIKSSMVLPIKTQEERLVGVMNLAALETSSIRFNTDSVRLMARLIELATVTLH